MPYTCSPLMRALKCNKCVSEAEKQSVLMGYKRT